MSILIKGMEMPKSCWECRFNASTIDHREACLLTKKTYNWGLTTPPSDCPLTEIPPHGDLIDRDELLGQYGGPVWTAKTDYAEGLRDVVADIKYAAAVIPADYPPSVPLEQVWTELFGEECE